MRIFINQNISEENNEYIIKDPNNLKHVQLVMRKAINDHIEVVDGSNNAYSVEIINFNPFTIRVIKLLDSAESNINIDIYQGIPKFDKMEYIIQKSTELGVRNIFPLNSERTIVKLKEKDLNKKIDRWNKIAESAAKQSKRNYIPQVKNSIGIDDIDFDRYDLNIFLDTKGNQNLQDLELLINGKKEEIKNISVIMGPEGGFSEKERQFLNKKAISIKLGNRILRTETASISILSILQYILGNF